MSIKRLGIALLLGLFTLSGCTAGMWQSNEVMKKESSENTVITDNIVSFFQYQQLKIIAQAGDINQQLHIPQQGIGFLGENNIYFLTHGETQLMSLNQHIDQIPLVSVRSKDSIRLQFFKADNPNVTGNFIETYQVKVNKPKQELTVQNLETIKELGFKYNGHDYVKDIRVEGVIINRASLDIALNPQQKLNRSYKIEFYTIDQESHFSAENLVSNVVLTPLTLVGDIVFIPVAFGFLMAISD
ncbi:hypothetical protein SOASR032_13520 [Pragia fontium]|uniref:Lipoprotein n=1 Tax=Pragia fontium TaxID=82985 RepID=A0ABQ5LJS2_9GAMM|nr:hypothetical protein [Pragia fontium]GKX62783.1 hypothetical protein SOASR032_13520 [Pragia fontium]